MSRFETMGLLNKLFGNKNSSNEWEEIKSAGEAYPKPSVATLRIRTKNGQMGSGWVDKAYKDYQFKKSCASHFMIEVVQADGTELNKSATEMSAVEDLFGQALKKLGVAHMVARVVTDNGLNITMYVENKDASQNCLEQLKAKPDYPINFTWQTSNDPKWAAVNGLMAL